jgi:hypothetical protein
MYQKKLKTCSSTGEIRVIPMISDVSDLLLPPARFMVKCVCGPLNPNFFAATLERRLASIGTRV